MIVIIIILITIYQYNNIRSLFLSRCQCRAAAHQVVHHPHEGLELQLSLLPAVLTRHVDVVGRGALEDQLSVVGRVQQDQVVHAARAGDGAHLGRSSRRVGGVNQQHHNDANTNTTHHYNNIIMTIIVVSMSSFSLLPSKLKLQVSSSFGGIYL